jgi:ABC-type branched-subunit amino acid transport system ATPase component/ABC-type branched-subunit amino acid transport system permease subunit
MTEAARDLYLLVAVFGLGPAVTLAGMPVLAQSAFVAVGGVGALQLERAGLPIGAAVISAIALGAVAGALTGALVARADPPFVALATWALAWLAYVVLLSFPSLSGGPQGLTRPALDRVETPFGVTLTLTPRVHVIAAALLVVVAYLIAGRLRRGPAGLDAVALREDAELARSLRVPVAQRRAALLSFAGAAAAAAGAGIALLLGVAAPADVSPLLALQLLAAVIAAGRHPLLGVLVIVTVPRAASALDDPAAGAVLTAALLLAAVALRRRELAPRDSPATRRRAGGARGPHRDHAAPARPPGVLPDLPVNARGLVGRDLHVTLGGRPILRGLDLELRAGEIHALVGPNGSGKTTALRVLAGELGGRVEGGPVARTFQRAAGFASLTPYRQLRLALQPGGALWHLVGLPAETDDDERAWTLLALTGLTAEAHIPPDRLSAGQLRLLAVARAVATGAPVLALDEPAAGMTATERTTLAGVLREVAGAGRAVLVIEHDLRLVAATADIVTVIDDGRGIAHGPPDDVIADATVQRVYLGAPA